MAQNAAIRWQCPNLATDLRSAEFIPRVSANIKDSRNKFRAPDFTIGHYLFWLGFATSSWASRISAGALAPLGVHAPNQKDHGAQHHYRKRPYDHRRPDE